MRLKKILLDDIGLKVGSIFLALLLWYVIQGEKEIEAFLHVDVQLVNRPKNLIVMNEVNSRILLTVRGSQSKIAALKEGSIKPYRIELEGADAGTVLFRVFSSDFKLPTGVKVTRINPQLIEVNLEAQRTRRVPVKATLVGELERGFKVGTITIDPPFVAMVGAGSEIKRITELFTTEISLAGRRHTFNEEWPLVIKNGGSVWLEQDKPVKVAVTVLEEEITATLKKLSVVIDDSRRYRIAPEQIDLTLRGPAGAVHDLVKTPPAVRLIIPKKLDFKAGKPRTLRLVPRLTLPPGVKIATVRPRRVLVTVWP